MPPQTQGKPQIKVTRPDGTIGYYDADKGREEIMRLAAADAQSGAPSLIGNAPVVPEGSAPALAGGDWGKATKDAVALGVDVGGLMIPGGLLGKTVARTIPKLAGRLPQAILAAIQQGGLGATSSALDGQDAATGGAISGGLELASAGAPWVRRGFNRGALAFGGVKGETAPILDAVEALRETQPTGRSIPLGAQRRTGREIKKKGEALGNRVKEIDADMQQTWNVNSERAGVERTNASRRAAEEAEARAAANAKPAQGGQGVNVGPTPPTTSTEVSPWVLKPVPSTKVAEQVDAEWVREVGGGASRGLGADDLPVPEFPPGSVFPPERLSVVDQALAKDQRIATQAGDATFPVTARGAVSRNQTRFVDEQTTEALRPGRLFMNASDVTNLKRNTADAGKDIFRSRKAGERLSPVDDALAQQQANWSSGMREVQEGLDSTGQIGKLNKNLSNLFTVQEANDLMRGGGGVVTDIGQYGMRGGLSHGLGQTVLGKTNGSQGTVMDSLRQLIPLLGMIGLAPSNISRLGNAAALFPKVANRADWLAEIDRETEESSIPGIKRKEPR